MKDEIEQYDTHKPAVEEVGPHHIRAFVGDATPKIGSTVWVGNVPTRVRGLIGARQVEAVAFDTTGIRAGDPIRVDAESASWPAPREGVTDVTDLAFAPGRPRQAPNVPRDAEILPTGIDTLDRRLPVARNGVNVILDAGADDEVIDRLMALLGFETVVMAGVRRPAFDVSHQISWDGADGMALALQTAANWAYELGDVLLYAESGPIDLDEWTRVLGSTVVVRVHLEDGLEVIAETLDIGTTDCQIFVRPDGTIDFARSHGKLATDDSWPQKVGEFTEIADKVAIFGGEELEPAEQTLYEVVREAEQVLLDSADQRPS